jgi:phage FluMu protein Com
MVRPDGKEVVACSSNFTRDGKRRYLGSQVDAVSRSGRLRIVRAGTVAVFFAAEGDGGEFREIYRCPVVPDPLRMVRLGAYTGQAHEPVDVRVLDMRIRAESLADELIAAAEVDEDASGWLVVALIVTLVLVVLGGLSFYLHRRRQAHTDAQQQPNAAVASTAFVCTSCGRKLKAKPELAGRKVKCPQCRTVVELPAVQAGNADTHIVAEQKSDIRHPQSEIGRGD